MRPGRWAARSVHKVSCSGKTGAKTCEIDHVGSGDVSALSGSRESVIAKSLATLQRGSWLFVTSKADFCLAVKVVDINGLVVRP